MPEDSKSEPKPAPRSSVELAEERQVPDELLQKLHAATERFHQAKKSLDESMNSAEYSHQTTVDQATDQLRIAEREVEQITMAIHGSITLPPPGGLQH